jgi:hypothetical protein
MEQRGSHWKDFYETWYLIFFQKSVEKIQVSLKYDNHSGSLHENVLKFVAISR